MSFVVKTTSKTENAASFVASAVLKQLKLGKKVLLFLTGGSSIPVGVEVAKLLSNHSCENLTVTLTDERYGPLGHKDSNWQQLLNLGFNLSQAKIIPILTNDNLDQTTEKFNNFLNQKFIINEDNEYKIGLFGIGEDGHTAGILPESAAVNSGNWAFGYKTEKFERVTITPKTIEKLDEAIVWTQGENKWKVLEDLEKDIDTIKQPAQVLKKVPLLTIFTDFKKI
jgi:6-phosphogluconolactonase/glucosamine-6-phosphate isomerase/deaminase